MASSTRRWKKSSTATGTGNTQQALTLREQVPLANVQTVVREYE